MAKIIGNTTATPTPASDWLQTDEKKADYIKNKPEIIELAKDLSVSGKAAEAKAVGDALESLKSEIPSVPVQSVNGKTGAVSLGASDVGALPSTTKIPSKTSDLTNDSSFATESYVNTQVSNLVNSAPDKLNTLDELAAALGDDENFANTVTTELSKKANSADLGALAKKSTVAKSDLDSAVQTSLNKADSALQSYTETDPTVPSWAKAASKPTYTASEVGAVSKTELTSAVNDALTQAKASGEFDGKDGIDGVSPTINVSKTGEVTKLTITDKNGTKTVDIEDGANGNNGQSIHYVDSNLPKQNPDGYYEIATISKYQADDLILFNDYNVCQIKIFESGYALCTLLFSIKGSTGAAGKDGADGNGIKSAVLNADYTLTLTFTDGTSYTTPSIRGATGASGSNGKDGADGDDGRGITSITRTSGNGSAGTTDTYTIKYTDNTTSTFTVVNGKNGSDGKDGAAGSDGIYVGSGSPPNGELIQIDPYSSGNTLAIPDVLQTTGNSTVDTMSQKAITDALSNATVSDAQIASAIEAYIAENPIAGANGRGIASIARTSGTGAAGTTDTYTITYTDNTKSTFTVYNGKNGTNGTNGTNGKSAYQYAQSGGYTGTETAFTTALAGVANQTTETWTFTLANGSTVTKAVVLS